MDNERNWPKFQTRKPKVLLLTSQYFLMGEIVAACERMEVPHLFLDLASKEMSLEDFVKTVLDALTSFKPDFVLTVNHLGVDHEGVLTQILESMEVPLVSWFVDNPSLILPLYAPTYRNGTAVFTWDADTVEPLGNQGFANVQYLPLAADTNRFVKDAPGKDDWNAELSFVGNSMVAKVKKRFDAAKPGKVLAARYRDVATAFGRSGEQSPAMFLADKFPDLWAEFKALKTPLRMLAFETLITWQSTQDYRLECLKKTLGFNPLIVGDKGWKKLLGEPDEWRYLPELNYYADLPGFYPCSKINFNCTSLQMKGAVNQRVFDVPACGAFLITDQRRQMDELFEPGKEIISYSDPGEIPDLVERYLADDAARKAVSEAARTRILAEHTYDHRLETLLNSVRLTFA